METQVKQYIHQFHSIHLADIMKSICSMATRPYQGRPTATWGYRNRSTSVVATKPGHPAATSGVAKLAWKFPPNAYKN